MCDMLVRMRKETAADEAALTPEFDNLIIIDREVRDGGGGGDDGGGDGGGGGDDGGVTFVLRRSTWLHHCARSSRTAGSSTSCTASTMALCSSTLPSCKATRPRRMVLPPPGTCRSLLLLCVGSPHACRTQSVEKQGATERWRCAVRRGARRQLCHARSTTQSARQGTTHTHARTLLLIHFYAIIAY